MSAIFILDSIFGSCQKVIFSTVFTAHLNLAFLTVNMYKMLA